MKNLILLAGLIVCMLSCKSTQPEVVKTQIKEPANPETYGNTITSDELKDMLYTYASDEFEGREAGQPGEKIATNYIKQQYVDLGIASPLADNNYFQAVPLVKRYRPEIELSINGTPTKMFDDFMALNYVQTQTYTTEDIVYVGYGIETEDYSDYKNVDVTGKVVLAKAGEAKNEDGTYVTTGTTGETTWSSGRRARNSKIEVATKKGAKGFIIIDNGAFNYYSNYYIKYGTTSKGKLGLKDNREEIMALLINEETGKMLYKDVLNENNAKTVATALSIDLNNDKTKDVASENVIAFIEGSEKPNEYIIISAHLDHEGMADGKVYNGADDDGSGTVAILEIAEAFQTAVENGYTPKRSVVFLHVTAEEKGLLGSKHYTDNDPIFPLENTVANLNIDMIGRVDKLHTKDRNYVYSIGSDRLSSELKEVSEAMNNKYTNINLDYRYDTETDLNRYYERSDHYNFAKHQVPVIFYFNGGHDDYHKPTDTPDKIEYDLLETRARLVFYTAWELANRDERIMLDEKHTVKASE